MTILDLGVKHFGGGEYSFTVNVDTTTVKDLKNLLVSETGLPFDDQILVYSGKTLTDEQTLKGAGVYGNVYKVILGSKSYNPCVKREDAAPVPPVRDDDSCVHRTLKYEFGGIYAPEDMRDLGYSTYHLLKKMSKKVTLENLERVAGDAIQDHVAILRRRKEHYYRNFLDSYWLHWALDRRKDKMRVEKTQAALVAEAAEDEARGEP